MWDNTYGEEHFSYCEERFKKRRKNVLKILAVFIIIIVFVGIFGPVAFNAGYVPIRRFMSVKKPIGGAEEINIDEHINKHPEIKEIPYIDKFKYQVFGINRSIDDVENEYKRKLGSEGYNLLYEGVAYKDEIPLNYYGFIKGLTGVGIVITSDKNFTLNYETMVLYTTGSVIDYRNILKWYKENNDDLLSDIYI